MISLDMTTDTHTERRVFIGLSGGVDSSVAAYLLCAQGYEVIGVTIDTGCGDAPEAAARAARELGIEHRVIDLKERFRGEIISEFISAYTRGLTPSPCLRCNPLIKFAALLDQCEKAEDMIATGHYVVKRQDAAAGLFFLTCGDQAKDQSYFLSLLTQEQIARCLFPLARMNKDQVRSLAGEHGLCSAQRRDSFDVCFIPNGDYRSFLLDNGVVDHEGEIIDVSGRVLGLHSGLSRYTVGQRRGLDLALGYPAYVLELDSENNRLTVGPREFLYSSEAIVEDCVFQSIPTPSADLYCQVRVRHKAALSTAVLSPLPQRGPFCFKIKFEKPEWGIAPGQYAAFYDGDRLLGGGRFLKE